MVHRIECNRVGRVDPDLHMPMNDVRVVLDLRQAVEDLVRELDDLSCQEIHDRVVSEGPFREDERIVVWTADQNVIAS